MKRSSKVFLTALVGSTLALGVGGCFTTVVDPHTAGLEAQVRGDLKVDVKVGEPIEGEASVDSLFFLTLPWSASNFADPVQIFGPYGLLGLSDVEQARAGARYDALTKSGADVIVAPRYTVSMQNFLIYKTVTARVTGYKGTTLVPYQLK